MPLLVVVWATERMHVNWRHRTLVKRPVSERSKWFFRGQKETA